MGTETHILRDPVSGNVMASLGDNPRHTVRRGRILPQRFLQTRQHVVKPVNRDQIDLLLAIESRSNLLHNLIQGATVHTQQVKGSTQQACSCFRARDNQERGVQFQVRE